MFQLSFLYRAGEKLLLSMRKFVSCIIALALLGTPKDLWF